MVKTDGGEIEIESKSIENEETKDDDHENDAEDAEEEPEEEREPSPGLFRHFFLLLNILTTFLKKFRKY